MQQLSFYAQAPQNRTFGSLNSIEPCVSISPLKSIWIFWVKLITKELLESLPHPNRIIGIVRLIIILWECAKFYNPLYCYILFCRSQDDFYSFVDEIIAEGGKDGPEDVIGGLQTALNQLSWGDEDAIKVNERITFVNLWRRAIPCLEKAENM